MSVAEGRGLGCPSAKRRAEGTAAGGREDGGAAQGYPGPGSRVGIGGGLWRAGGIDGCCGACVKPAAGPEGHVGDTAWGKPSLAVLHPGQLDPSPALTDALQLERDQPLGCAASGTSLSRGAGEIVPAAREVGGNLFDLCPGPLFGISW